MIAYWLLFLSTAYRALEAPTKRWTNSLKFTLWSILTLIIGLRHEVGCDWDMYARFFNGKPMELDLSRDPGYSIIQSFSSGINADVYGVNFISAGIFAFGLVVFCAAQRRPWLALTMAIPYLVIVVAMGYTRQSVAIGLLMPGFLALERGHLRHFLCWVAVAASFHQTSVITLVFLLPAIPGRTLKIRLIRTILTIFFSILLARIFLWDRIGIFIFGYLMQKMSSEGATIRVAMNTLPAIALLIFGYRLKMRDQEGRVWFSIALYSVACLIGLFILPSTTVVDRLALYAIPIQIYAGSRVPEFRIFDVDPRVLTFGVVILACLIQAVWLFASNHAKCWLPYTNILIS